MSQVCSCPPKLLFSSIGAGETPTREVRIRGRKSGAAKAVSARAIRVIPTLSNPRVDVRSRPDGDDLVLTVELSRDEGEGPPDEGGAVVRVEHDDAGQSTEIPLKFFYLRKP